MWQDILLMAGGFGFSIALIPSVISRSKPARLTCVVTGAILVSFAVAYATLGLWLATISVSITALLWFVLLVQGR